MPRFLFICPVFGYDMLRKWLSKLLDFDKFRLEMCGSSPWRPARSHSEEANAVDMTITRFLKPIAALTAVAAVAVSSLAAPAMAQSGQQVRRDERYVPTIWIDPDGCEHWVMDDGAEGYMDARKTRDGRPVCHRNVCGVVPTDQLFATDKSAISASGRKYLESFFRNAQARAFIITGHTDSRASDEYNMRLSKRRAEAVASVASSIGANVLSVNWYGERQPRATNGTAAGMAQNRRVEIICVK
jgi:outer membrane protein OmpA-like peptidoglycan-associated protein